MAKGKKKYRKELPRELYTYFIGQTDSVPSFSKFARRIGVTLDELKSYRVKRKFDAAYKECEAIRRDAIIDGALARRLDSSFAKFLLCDVEEAESGGVEVTLRVIEG